MDRQGGGAFFCFNLFQILYSWANVTDHCLSAIKFELFMRPSVVKNSQTCGQTQAGEHACQTCRTRQATPSCAFYPFHLLCCRPYCAGEPRIGRRRGTRQSLNVSHKCLLPDLQHYILLRQMGMSVLFFPRHAPSHC